MDTSLAPPLESFLSRIDSLLQEIIRYGGFELAFAIRKTKPAETELESPEIVVDFTGGDADLLLERNGALLDALEYTVLKAVRLEEEFFGKITFDCKDWRQTRALELKLTAQVAAQRVVETGAPFPLNAMTPRERRIIHLALKDQPLVCTLSEGAGANRRVVIVPVSAAKRPLGR